MIAGLLCGCTWGSGIYLGNRVHWGRIPLGGGIHWDIYGLARGSVSWVHPHLFPPPASSRPYRFPLFTWALDLIVPTQLSFQP